MNQVNDNAPFLLIQKPQELIKLFEGLIDRKIREIAIQIPPLPTTSTGESPFLSTKEVQKIFSVSRQTIFHQGKIPLIFFPGSGAALQQKWATPSNQ